MATLHFQQEVHLKIILETCEYQIELDKVCKRGSACCVLSYIRYKTLPFYRYVFVVSKASIHMLYILQIKCHTLFYL